MKEEKIKWKQKITFPLLKQKKKKQKSNILTQIGAQKILLKDKKFLQTIKAKRYKKEKK